MNYFDLVVTVAFGSTLSTIFTSGAVALSSGLFAIASLVFLQFIITRLSVRSHSISEFVKTAPTILFENGQFHHIAMKRVRVTPDEVRSAARRQGIGGLEEIAAVVMETGGSLSVISNAQHGSGSAL